MQHIDPRLDEIKDCLYRVAVKLAIVQDGKLLIVDEKEGWQGLPGGGLEHGETIAQTIERELQEEIGLKAGDVVREQQPFFIVHDGVLNNIPRVCILYRAQLKPGAVIQNQELTFRWVDAAELHNIQLSPSTKGAHDELLKLLDN